MNSQSVYSIIIYIFTFDWLYIDPLFSQQSHTQYSIHEMYVYFMFALSTNCRLHLGISAVDLGDEFQSRIIFSLKRTNLTFCDIFFYKIDFHIKLSCIEK